MLKRTIDVLAAGLTLVVLSPVIALVALLVRVRLGSPVLFRQQRPGRNGELFTLLKFRTMLDGDGSDAERLTSFGRKLRATSLDELPELLNVLRGDMSIVGPRPLLVEYLPLYSEHHSRRHEVRPGITGWAQASGRNDLPWDSRFDLDVEYVDQQSFWLDVKIVLMTIRQLASRSGIDESGSATMTKFTGSIEVGS